MKKTKVIIPALGLLVLSTAASVTGTVAWFSMNSQVSATGMTINAKSDAIFLQIANSSGTYGTSAAADTPAANANNLYPVAHETLSGIAALETLSNWYYMYSNSAADYTGVTATKKTLAAASATFGDYVYKTTFSVKLEATSGLDTAYDLYVKNFSVTANKGIHAIIAGSTGFVEYSATTSDIAFANNLVISDTVTTTASTVSVYLWFDGNDANVYSNNITVNDQLNLTGDVSFDLEVFTADHNA